MMETMRATERSVLLGCLAVSVLLGGVALGLLLRVAGA